MTKATLNTATLIAYVGKDPVVRKSFSGKQVVEFPVVTNSDWRDARGQRCSKEIWHRVVVYHEAVAQIAAKFVKKGSRILIEGSIENRRWMAKSGERDNTVTEIVLSGFNARLLILDHPPEASLVAQTEASTADDLAAASTSPPDDNKIDASRFAWLTPDDDHDRARLRGAGDDDRRRI